MIKWDDAAPVFFDFETQSACELKETGGRIYAADPSTRVLTCVFLVDGVFYCWIPRYLIDDATAKRIDNRNIWPHQLGAPRPLEVHVSLTPPGPVKEAVRAGRTFVAHNCFGFDRFIWEYCIQKRGIPWRGVEVAPPWADTMPLARAAGLPGALDKIAQELVSVGKDNGKRILHKHIHAEATADGFEYTRPGVGDLEVILRYNLADVELLARAWQAFDQLAVEADVIAAHDAINERGVRVDTALASKLVELSRESVTRAGDTIAKLTDGALTRANLRSVQKVNAWLASKGVRILGNAIDADGNRKRTLRKDFVEQAIANPWTMLDDDAPVAAVQDIDPAVFDVLRLRGAALRITGAKADRAVIRTSPDGRARDVHTYHTAHTGRFSSAGIQVHNLPRPKKDVPVDALLDWLASSWGESVAANYDAVSALVPKGNVDDAISSLLRPLFIPAAGCAFGIVDYAAIECRGVAWIAGEEQLLDTLASGGDVYRVMAGKIFGVSPDAVTDTQRQVGKVTVLGCGYSMSAEKFRLYCGLQGIDLHAAGTTADACVEGFRGLYSRIAGEPAGMIDGKPYRAGGVWSQLARAAMDAVRRGGIHEAGRTRWAYDGSTLRCQLPSGRILHYRGARIEDRVPGYAAALGLDRPKATLVYESPLGERTLYGGKITENVVQALCRDLLATALVRLEADSFRVVLHVHDEVVTELPIVGTVDDLDEPLNEMTNVMTTPPEWAAGFPVAVEGFAAPRYLKAAPKGWPKVKAAKCV